MTRDVIIALGRGVVFLAAVVTSVASQDGWSAANDGHGAASPLIVHVSLGPHPGVVGGIVNLEESRNNNVVLSQYISSPISLFLPSPLFPFLPLLFLLSPSPLSL